MGISDLLSPCYKSIIRKGEITHVHYNQNLLAFWLSLQNIFSIQKKTGCHGRMVVGFTTTYVVSAYHH